MKYFFELWDGAEFTLGGIHCRRLSKRGYEIVSTGQQCLVGSGRFRVRIS
jgi:hypothetical protein